MWNVLLQNIRIQTLHTGRDTKLWQKHGKINLQKNVLKVFGTPRCPIVIDPFVVRDLPEVHHDCLLTMQKFKMTRLVDTRILCENNHARRPHELLTWKKKNLHLACEGTTDPPWRERVKGLKSEWHP